MLLTLLIFLAVLSVLVLAHEWGHFIAARKSGIAVEEFGFGFPPRLWSKQIGATRYSVNWIPLGGFVKLKGEDGADKESEDSFARKKVWQRAIVISAGVFMNVVLAFALFTAGFMIGLPSSLSDQLPAGARVRDRALQVVEVLPESPAAEAGIAAGDTLKSVGDAIPQNIEDVRFAVEKNGGLTPLAVRYEREGKEFSVDVTPKVLEETGALGIGVGAVSTGVVSFPWYAAPIEGAKVTAGALTAIIIAFYDFLKGIFLGQGVPADSVAGPVGIAALTGKVARLGFTHLLQFTALLSLNLAVINFFPFPALDGGRFIFLLLEMARRKPVSARIESAVHSAGFALLMLLVILVTYKDITRYTGTFGVLWRRLFGA